MLQSVRSVTTEPPLEILEDVLWEWIAVQERSARFWEWKDAPWWYNECASLSMFAGAVWRSGGIALEEYSTEKRQDASVRKRTLGTSSGRGDLYLKVGDREFILEAKQCWSSAGARAGHPCNRISKKMSEALVDVRRAKSYGEERLGSAFAVPYIPKREFPSVDQCLEQWLKSINDLSCACRAWVFPPEVRRLSYKTAVYPGVAVFIEQPVQA